MGSSRTFVITDMERESPLYVERQVIDLRQTLGKSTPAQHCEPGVLAQETVVGNYFVGEI
jgi:hypothetical protein